MYDENGRITRAGAEQAIRDGGTVFVLGRQYGRVENLPPEAAFAAGDPKATQRAMDTIAAQRKQLDDQERQLLQAADNSKDAVKEAEKRDKARAKEREAAPPPTLHQQTGGRPLMPNENTLAEDEANERAERELEAAGVHRHARGAGRTSPAAGTSGRAAGKSRKSGARREAAESADKTGAAAGEVHAETPPGQNQ